MFRILWLTLVIVGLMYSPALRLSAAEELRDWHITTGQSEEVLAARVVDLAGGKVLLRDAADKQHEVALDKLTAADRKEALNRVVGRGVVLVQTKDLQDRPLGSGSGFVFSQQGYVMTNYHVLRGAASASIKFRGAEEPVAVDCLMIDPVLDIAILKAAKLPAEAYVLKLASEKPSTGASVWTLGYPNGILTPDWGEANGIYATRDLPEQLRRMLLAPAETTWIQTDAVLAGGSSGGPLLNEQGEVVGLNTFVVGGRQGFALTIDQSRDAFKQAQQAKPLKLPFPPPQREPLLAWPSREVAPLLKAYSQAMQKLNIDAQSLTPAQAQAKLLELNKEYRQKFLDIAHQDPQSWPSAQALLITCDLSLDGSPESRQAITEVCDVVRKHHLQSFQVSDFAQKMSQQTDDAAHALCRDIIKASQHHEVQAHAMQCLALGRLRWLQQHGGLDLAQTKSAREEISTLTQQLVKNYSDVPLGPGTAKELARQFEEYLSYMRIGQPAPEITGKDSAGQEFKLSDYRGKVVMLDFFGDYCEPCRSMYPAEQKMVEDLKERPFALLGVNIDEPATLASLVKAGTVKWPTWADGPGGPISTAWRVNAVPCIYLIDPQGIVRQQFNGVPTEQQLQGAIQTLLRETEKR